MSNRITGIYNTTAEADTARQALKDAGIGNTNIRTVTPEDLDQGTGSSGNDSQSIGDKVTDFFTSMFGESDGEKVPSQHMDAVRSGSTLVVVDTDDPEHQRLARGILDGDGASQSGAGAAGQSGEIRTAADSMRDSATQTGASTAGTASGAGTDQPGSRPKGDVSRGDDFGKPESTDIPSERETS